MKKLFSCIFLAIILLFGVCACSDETVATPPIYVEPTPNIDVVSATINKVEAKTVSFVYDSQTVQKKIIQKNTVDGYFGTRIIGNKAIIGWSNENGGKTNYTSKIQEDTTLYAILGDYVKYTHVKSQENAYTITVKANSQEKAFFIDFSDVKAVDTATQSAIDAQVAQAKIQKEAQALLEAETNKENQALATAEATKETQALAAAKEVKENQAVETALANKRSELSDPTATLTPQEEQTARQNAVLTTQEEQTIRQQTALTPEETQEIKDDTALTPQEEQNVKDALYNADPNYGVDVSFTPEMTKKFTLSVESSIDYIYIKGVAGADIDLNINTFLRQSPIRVTLDNVAVNSSEKTSVFNFTNVVGASAIVESVGTSKISCKNYAAAILANEGVVSITGDGNSQLTVSGGNNDGDYAGTGINAKKLIVNNVSLTANGGTNTSGQGGIAILVNNEFSLVQSVISAQGGDGKTGGNSFSYAKNAEMNLVSSSFVFNGKGGKGENTNKNGKDFKFSYLGFED